MKNDETYSMASEIQQNFNSLNQEANYPNIFSTVTHTVDVMDQARAVLFSGKDCRGIDKVLGSRYFLPAGKCGASSDPPCINQDRYLYLDNIPKSTYPCVDASQPYDRTCDQQGNNGILPGLIQDVISINPFEMWQSAKGKGSVVNDRCILRSEPVGHISLDGTQDFITETRCSPAPAPLICNIVVEESFTNPSRSPQMVVWILWFITILFLFYKICIKSM